MTNNTTQAPAFVLGMTLTLAFVWTVRVPVPGDDDYSHATLPLMFRPLDQTELDRIRGIGLAEGEAVLTDEQIIRLVVVGWPSLKNAAGEELPFNDENLGHLLTAPMMRSAIVATYLAAMSGMAARKNA